MDLCNKKELVDGFVDSLPILRTMIGLSQSELGDYLGMSRQSFSSIESKRRRMTWSLFLACLFSFIRTSIQKSLL